MKVRNKKKPLNPAVVWIAIVVVIAVVAILYLVVGKKTGSTGFAITAGGRKFAQERQKYIMEHGEQMPPGPGSASPQGPQAPRPGAPAGSPR